MEMEWCVQKLQRNREIEKIVDRLDMANTIAVAAIAGRKNHTAYTKWRMAQINRMEDLQNEEQLTVFDKIRGHKRTVFDQLKEQ